MSVFTPGQIVYLSHSHLRLYGEVIQIAEARQLCWVRPLLLTEQSDTAAVHTLILPDDADLLWPLSAFQPALDIDLLPLFPFIAEKSSQYPDLLSRPHREQGQQQLRQFLARLWESPQP